MIKETNALASIEQLIQGCLKRNAQSQSELYRLLMQPMFAVCLRYAKNREEAEEILQEGFMKVFEHIGQYAFAGPFEGWVRKIMVNCALQKYRSKASLRIVSNTEITEHELADTEAIVSQISTRELLQMVQQLPPACRLVFNLYVFEGMKHREIATLLKISEGTSKSNLSDARLMLQKAVAGSLQVVNQKTV